MFSIRLSRESGLTHLFNLIISMTLVFLIVTPAVSVGQQPSKASSPEEVTRHFYNWYFSAHFPNPKRANMAAFRKYVTQSFLKRATAPDVDAVLFIDAQDTDQTWANNFTVSTATIHGPKATVSVALNGKEMKYNLLVTLTREGGVWKIDDVKGSNP